MAIRLSDIILIVFVIFIIYILYTGNIDNFDPYIPNNNANSPIPKIMQVDTSFDQNLNLDLNLDDISTMSNYDTTISSCSKLSDLSLLSQPNIDIQRETLNPNFIDIQFHNDYRDIITALNNLVPEKKQRFNVANIPIVYSKPDIYEVQPIMIDFVQILNENIKSAVPLYRNPNSGWDEAVIDPTIESGWDRVQKSLGLPVSLYHNPASNAMARLISIMLVQKYETEDEIKYAVTFVLQKQGVDDQALLKATFVQDKRILRDENNFFVSKKVDMKIIIEDVYILGYLSKGGLDAAREFDLDTVKYYEYDQMENNNLVDPKDIQKILMEKYKERTTEMDMRNALLDEEGQAFHKTLPALYDYSNVKDTWTIFNDMNNKKVFT